MRAGIIAALVLFACASPGAPQPASPPMAERIPALERLPADALVVVATPDLAATAAALGWPDVLDRFGDLRPRLAAELRSRFGLDLTDPSTWAEIGIAPGAPGGIAVFGGSRLVLVCFVELEDSFRFQTFLHESKEALGPLRTRTEGQGLIALFGIDDHIGAVVRGNHAFAVFADHQEDLAPTLSRLVRLTPERSLAREPAFLAVQAGSDADVSAYVAVHRIAERVRAAVEEARQYARDERDLARTDAELRAIDELLRPIGGVGADLWLHPAGLRLEARANVAASAPWTRLFSGSGEPSWRAIAGLDGRAALSWAAAVDADTALAIARLTAGGREVDAAAVAGFLRGDLGKGLDPRAAVDALPAPARELFAEPAALRLAVDLPRAVAVEKASPPIAPVDVGADAPAAVRELAERYQVAGVAIERARAELADAQAAQDRATTALVGTTAVAVQQSGERWTLRALQVGMTEGPRGILAALLDAELRYGPTRRALREARQRAWQAEDELYRLSRALDDAQREVAPALILGNDAAAALGKDAIARVVRSERASVRYCYETALVANPELAGKVVVTFTVAADGTVESAAVKSSTLGHPDTERCIVGVIAKLRFPSPDGGAKVTVNYPFVLQPSP